MCPSHFTSMSLIKGKESLHLYKNVYLNVHSFICNNQELETTQCPTNSERMNTKTGTYPCNELLLSREGMDHG